MELLIIGAALLVAVGVLAFGIISMRQSREEDIEEVLGRYTSNVDAAIEALEAEEEEAERQRRENAVVQALDKAIEDGKFANKWREELARADLRLTPGEFMLAHVASVLAFSAITFVILSPGNIIAALIAGAAGFFAPRIWVGQRKGRRFRQFEQQLPDTLGMWVNGLRSGYSVMQAMEAIAKEAPEPTASEFRRVVTEIQFGITREDALEHMLQRMPSEDLDLIIVAVNIQQEVGGNLAEILDVISHTIRERIKLKGEVRVLTSQGRITGYIIGGLPIMLAVFLFFVSGDYMRGMVENRLCGWPMLGCGAILIGLGFAAIRKIVDIDI
ncbi:MAG: secretion system protein F [Chloroflexi bacterium]|nr:secretion system protein F [Chloroflexota bacterium]